jgi:hypothetical protein
MTKKSLEFQKFNDEGDEMNTFNKLIDQMGYTKYNLFVTIVAATILAVDGAQSLLLAFLLSLMNQKIGLTEYDLAIISTMESIGYAVSNILVNLITQFISNTLTIQIFSILGLVSSGLCFSTFNFYVICATRFSFGFCMGIIDLLIYITLVEITPTKIRGFLSSLLFMFNPLGSFFVALYGYYELEDRRTKGNFYVLVMFPFVVLFFFIISVFFLQETPRTLLSQNKFEESIKSIERIDNFNNLKDQNTQRNKEELIKEIKEKIKRTKSVENAEKIASIASGRDIDKKSVDSIELRSANFYPKFRRIFNINYRKYTILIWLIVILTSFTSNGVFFMLPTTAPDLDKSTFVTVIVSVFIEIPSIILTSILIETSNIGRLRALKIGLVGTLIASSLFFIYLKPMVYVDCLLKFFINIPVAVITVYGSEIYDSKIRIFGCSAINFWKRISFIVSPITVAYFDSRIGLSTTYYLFLPFTIFALLLSFFLNIETRGVPLDEFGKNEG